MRKKTALTASPPYAVRLEITRIGMNLRTARLRRNLTIAAVAEKIGTGRRAVMDAEKGGPGTSVATYVALLWAYNLMDTLKDLADPATDKEGLILAVRRERARNSVKAGLSNDF